MSAVLSPAAAAKPRKEKSNRLVLYGIDWKTYVRILKALDHRHLRITYDRGALEIMTLSLKHEQRSRPRFFGFF